MPPSSGGSWCGRRRFRRYRAHRPVRCVEVLPAAAGFSCRRPLAAIPSPPHSRLRVCSFAIRARSLYCFLSAPCTVHGGKRRPNLSRRPGEGARQTRDRANRQDARPSSQGASMGERPFGIRSWRRHNATALTKRVRLLTWARRIRPTAIWNPHVPSVREIFSRRAANGAVAPC
jgi:hypothetical protein